MVDLDTLIPVKKARRGIPSVSILCRWQNCAGIRSGPTVHESIKTLALAPLILISDAFNIVFLSGNICIPLSVAGLPLAGKKFSYLQLQLLQIKF